MLLIEASQPQSSKVFSEQIAKVKAAAEALPDLFDIVETNRQSSQQITLVDDSLLDRPVFVYGSIQFVRDIKVPIFPGPYGMQGTDYATMTAHIPRKLLKNNDYVFTTWADLNINFMYWCAMLGSNQLFVRPVSDRKPFAGQTVISGEYAHKLNLIHSGSSVTGETLCVVAKSKRVYAEFRFFIVDRKIITHTSYGGFAGTNNIEFGPDIVKPAEDLARVVAEMEWQPDAAYTCDVTVDYTGEASIIELNSLSTAGVYNADVNKLMEAVHSQVLRDYFP